MRDPDSAHFIQRHIFDFQIEDKADAHAIQNELSKIFNESLVELLDKVLSEYDDQEHVIRIPRIELDIGEIPQKLMKPDLLVGVELQLRRALADIIAKLDLPARPEIPDEEVEEPEKVEQAPARMEIISHFLLYGTVQAAAGKNRASIESLFRDAIRQQPAVLRRTLIQLTEKSRAVLQRIVYQFSTDTIQQLYTALAPQAAQIVLGRATSLTQALRDNLPGTAPSTITEAVQTGILRYLLSLPGGVFETTTFETTVRQHLATQLGDRVLAILRADEAVSPVSETERADAMALIRTLVERGSTPETRQVVLQAWQYLVVHDAEALAEMLQEVAGTRVARIRAVLQLLPLAAIRDFVSAYRPRAARKIFEVAAALIGVYGRYAPGAEAEAVFQREVYVVILRELISGRREATVPDTLAAAIREHTVEAADIPAEMLDIWEDIDLSPARALEQAEQAEEEGRQRAAEAEAEAEAEAAREAEEAAAEAEPPEIDPETGWPIDKQTGRPVDPETGMQLHRESGLLIDPESGRFFDPETGEAVPAPEGFEEAAPEEDDKIDTPKVVDASRPLTPEEERRKALEEAGISPEQAAAIAEGSEEAFREELQRLAREAERRAGDEVTAHIDLVLHYLQTGEIPWWATSLETARMDTLITSIAQKQGRRLARAMREMLRERSIAQKEELVQRMLRNLSEPAIVKILELLRPQMVGFLATVARLLDRYREEAADLRTAPHISARINFSWFYVLRFVFEYEGRKPGTSVFIRYIIHHMAAATRITTKEFIRTAREIVNSAISKGERRFTALRSLLPPPDMPIEVTPPEETEPAPAPPEIGTPDPTLPTPETPPTAEEPPFTPDPGIPDARLPEDAPQAGEEVDFEPIAETEAEAELLEQIAEDDRETIRLIRHFFRHGSLPPEAADVSQEAFMELLQDMMETQPEVLAVVLRNIVGDKTARERLILLGDTTVVEMARMLNPQLMRFMEVYLTAVLQIFALSSTPLRREVVLDHAIYYAAFSRQTSFQPVHYFRHFFRFVLNTVNKDPGPVLIWLREKVEASNLSIKVSMLEVLQVIQREIDRPGQVERPRTTADEDESTQTPEVPVPEEVEEYYVKNAGLVLLWPFFNDFFRSLDFMDRTGQFKSPGARERAAQLLQYLVTKEVKVEEHELALNKVIVGLPIQEPLHSTLEITDEEKKSAEEMLEAVIKRWAVMKNSTPDSLRGSFLARDGRLKREGPNWNLRVDRRGFDMVLDRLPWSINVISLPWIPQYKIEVAWR